MEGYISTKRELKIYHYFVYINFLKIALMKNFKECFTQQQNIFGGV